MSVIFRNPGLADLRALTTLGVNIKPNSTNPIGYFGTGFKFGVATLLRNDCAIELWRGLERHVLTAKPVTIRGESFSVVCLDDRELGFTTALGKNWEPWQAYRELHCNAIDEGGETNGAHDGCVADFKGREDETWLIVTGAPINAAHSKRHEFLLLDKPQIVTTTCDVRMRPAKHVFYRGIAARRLEKPSRYTWNVTEAMNLSEDRTIDHYAAVFKIIMAINDLDDQKLIEDILTAPKAECFEGSLDFGWSSMISGASETFKAAVRSASRHNAGEINPTAAALFQRHWGDDFSEVATFTPDAIQATQLVSAVEFCVELGFDVTAYPILLAERLGKHQYGQAHNGRIYVTRLAFEAGTKIVAGTLIEEFIHLREGFVDESRALQDYLLNRVVTLGERLRGRPL